MEYVVNNHVTCNACGWVHFSVTRKSAMEQINSFNVYYDNLPESKQQDYYNGNPSSIAHYDRCMHCGGSYHNFSVSEANDCPDGSTIGPILHFNELDE